MVDQIIAVSGAMRSGKSSLTSALTAAVPGSGVVAFGAVTKREAVTRGYGDDREAKQRAGEELIEEGWSAFVRKLLDGAGDPRVLIVDGIRHTEAIDELARYFPIASVLVVFIDPSDAIRHERIEAAGEDIDAEQHPVEQSIPNVRDRADIVVSDVDLNQNVKAILAVLEA